MKKFLILIAAFLCAYQFSNAQTEKGSQTLGVNLGVGYNQYSDHSINTYNTPIINTNKITTFSIGPNYSYFIADKLDLGANLSYQYLINNSSYNNSGFSPNGPQKQTNSSYGATLYLRKYFLYANKIGFRTGPYITYANNDQKSTWDVADAANNSKSTSHNYTAGANLDLVYYPSTHLGVSATLANLAYNHYTQKNTYTAVSDTNTGNSVNLSFINSGLTFGVFYVFDNK